MGSGQEGGVKISFARATKRLYVAFQLYCIAPRLSVNGIVIYLRKETIKDNKEVFKNIVIAAPAINQKAKDIFFSFDCSI